MSIGKPTMTVVAYHSLELEMPDWRVNGKCAMISFWDNKAGNARWN
jgi:hypothetical protein